MKGFNRAAATLAGAMLTTCASIVHAAINYDFTPLTPGTVPSANESPVPAGTQFQGTTTIGQVAAGQDNWVWNSSTANINSAIVRSDASPGMSGNWVSAYPTLAANSTTNGAPPSHDSINSRRNAGGHGFGISSSQPFSVTFTATIKPITYLSATGVASSSGSRAQVALGYDQTGDGRIRGESANNENVEWGPLFGIEPTPTANPTTGTAGNFYVRPAALGTAVTAAAFGPGVYELSLVIDPTKNPNAGSATVYPGNDGAGTLYARRLFDGDGNPLNETLTAVPGLINVALGLTRMNTHNATNLGTVNGSNPAFWNGIVTRVSNNGGIDNIVITPEPAAMVAIGASALFMGRRRR